MNGRNAYGRSLLILGASAMLTAGLVGCETRNDDINRVQPGYQRKAIFQTKSEWYYRRTIVDSETTNQYAIEGSGDIPLDRVKFEIQEEFLLAYKPYESIPGSSTAELEGGEDFRGTLLAAWPITSHFDIIREYNALTGNTTNLIVENTTDRPWSERDYMRVDFANNVVENSRFGGWSIFEFPLNYISTGSYWTNLETRPTDPYASRFSDDYVEITDSAFIGMDIFFCALSSGFSWAAFGNCGFGEAKVRHSFVRIDEPSDFVPRDYPDSVVRKDPETGESIYDPETGEVVRESFYNRFGFFRLSLPTYDRGYGQTESGKIFRAMVHNIWENHRDEMGREIPMAQRTPAPIIYYLNTEYPERYRQTAEEIAQDYNGVFTRMVTDVTGSAPGFPMFEIRTNDCNEAAIINFVSERPEMLVAVERAVCSNPDNCFTEEQQLGMDLLELGDNALEDALGLGEFATITVDQLPDLIGIGNLKRVCTSLESATLDPMTGVSEFTWQRVGDARLKMLVWLDNPQQSGWGGYGPMHADSRTGEVVSATSYIRGLYYEIGAATVVDYIEFMNDEKSVEEIIYGQDVRKHISETLKRKGLLEKTDPSQRFVEMLGERMDRFGTGKSRLQEMPNRDYLKSRLNRIEGTRVEEALINEQQLLMAAAMAQGFGEEMMWRPGEAVPAELRAAATPAGMMTKLNPLEANREAARNQLGALGFCFLEHEFDNDWAALALELQGLNREERYRIVSNRLIKHVILHELGHNVGLAHNFEGSYDALNYNDQFWAVHSGTEEEKLDAGYQEFRHTTVMEYMSSKGLFADFLGKYDEAALRFGYANQVQIFTGDSVDENLQGGEALRQWRYYNDYKKIPDHLCGAGGCASGGQRMEALTSRDWVDFDPQNPPQNEVPYLFCDNAYNRMTPFCATFDYGSNMREIFATYYSLWTDYFFFNNFARDRLTWLAWSPQRAMTAVLLTMNFVDVVAQYFYYLNAVDPTFRDTDLSEDMAATLGNGLNMAAEVMATPEPVRMCPWPGSANPTIYIPHFFLNECDEYAALDSDYAISAEAIQLPLGDARPSTLRFTNDYEDYQWRMVGSYFDKRNMMIRLGWTNPRLLRFNYNLDRRTYHSGLYRLFETELRQFYDKLINLDGFFLRQDTATTLGSYWCRDDDSPGVAYLGHFEPRRLIDPTATDNPSLPGPTAQCRNPSVIYPELLANIPFDAMFLSHALFSSSNDGQLDMGKSLKVYAVGAPDDFADWSAFSNCETAAAGENCYCQMVDQLTGVQYRAIQQPEGVPDLGCRLIEFAEESQQAYNNSSGNPFYHDNWRQWIERLEFARDLFRIYQAR